MKDFRADLHCHSTCSDGSLAPIELITLAHQTGLKGLSITDHDTIAAYDISLLETSKQLNVELISGVELSSVYKDVSIHVLGYAFDLTSPLIKAFCDKHAERRENRNKEILELLSKLGMPLSYQDLKPDGSSTPLKKQTIGRPHIAQAMIKKGYVQSIQEAFRIYIGEDKPAYSKGINFSLEETLDVIHASSGLAILAHPHLIRNQKIIPDLLNCPFDGLEGYYSRMHLSQNKRWIKIAENRDWFVTGGSDFHGEIKPETSLGASWVREETFQKLRQHYLRTNPTFS
jgi:3',5'-nucleoside bisphosphate phosphatase